MSCKEFVYTDDVILSWLLEDLGRRNPAESTVNFLRALIQSARAEISAEGVEIPDEITDIKTAMLVENYAAFNYRKRGATTPETAMPRNLRYRLNNRVFGDTEE